MKSFTFLLVLALLIRVVLRQLIAPLNQDLAFGIYIASSYFILPIMVFSARDRLESFFLQSGDLRGALVEGCLLLLLALAEGVGEAYLLLGGVSFLPLEAVPVVLLNSFFTAALIEEVLFRGFLLGYLCEIGIDSNWAIVLQAAIFAGGHLRYLLGGRWWMLIIVLTWGLIFGWQVLRHKTIAGTLLVHTLSNTITFLLIGGTVHSL